MIAASAAVRFQRMAILYGIIFFYVSNNKNTAEKYL